MFLSTAYAVAMRDARKGRGAASNRSGRYERHRHEAFDDGWGTIDEAQVPLRTEVRPDTSRTVITRNHSPDLGFDRSINVYRGCEHGCVYCYARPPTPISASRRARTSRAESSRSTTRPLSSSVSSRAPAIGAA